MKDIRTLEIDDLRAELDVLDTFEARALAVNDKPTVIACQQRRRSVARRIEQLLQFELLPA